MTVVSKVPRWTKYKLICAVLAQAPCHRQLQKLAKYERWSEWATLFLIDGKKSEVYLPWQARLDCGNSVMVHARCLVRQINKVRLEYKLDSVFPALAHSTNGTQFGCGVVVALPKFHWGKGSFEAVDCFFVIRRRPLEDLVFVTARSLLSDVWMFEVGLKDVQLDKHCNWI